MHIYHPWMQISDHCILKFYPLEQKNNAKNIVNHPRGDMPVYCSVSDKITSRKIPGGVRSQFICPKKTVICL